jgi:hypothetical protein
MLPTSENQNFESLVKTMLENGGEFSKLWNEQYTVSLDPVDFTLTHPASLSCASNRFAFSIPDSLRVRCSWYLLQISARKQRSKSSAAETS